MEATFFAMRLPYQLGVSYEEIDDFLEGPPVTRRVFETMAKHYPGHGAQVRAYRRTATWKESCRCKLG